MKFYQQLKTKKIFCNQAISKLQDLRYWAAHEFLWFQKNEKVVKELNNESLVKTNEKLKELFVGMIGKSFDLISKFQEFHDELSNIEKQYANPLNDKKHQQKLQIITAQIIKKGSVLCDRMNQTNQICQSLIIKKEKFNKKMNVAKQLQDSKQKKQFKNS